MNDWIRVIAANKRNRLQIYARAVINLNKSISLIDKWEMIGGGVAWTSMDLIGQQEYRSIVITMDNSTTRDPIDRGVFMY